MDTRCNHRMWIYSTVWKAFLGADVMNLKKDVFISFRALLSFTGGDWDHLWNYRNHNRHAGDSDWTAALNVWETGMIFFRFSNKLNIWGEMFCRKWACKKSISLLKTHNPEEKPFMLIQTLCKISNLRCLAFCSNFKFTYLF